MVSERLSARREWAALGLRNERERHGKKDAEDDDLKHLASATDFAMFSRENVR